METKLTRKNYLIIGSLIFGMFFGAGNLIFPVHLGQLAGDHWLNAAGGVYYFRGITAVNGTLGSEYYKIKRNL